MLLELETALLGGFIFNLIFLWEVVFLDKQPAKEEKMGQNKKNNEPVARVIGESIAPGDLDIIDKAISGGKSVVGTWCQACQKVTESAGENFPACGTRRTFEETKEQYKKKENKSWTDLMALGLDT